MHCGYITQLKNLRDHPNANKLALAECFGNTVCIAKDSSYENQVVIYFPVDLQLSEEYCSYNDLVRRKDENGNPAGGYLDPEKRNVKAIRLRGEKSDGLVMPLSSLAFCYESNSPDVGVMNLSIGDQITVLNGHEICKKYIPRSKTHSVTDASVNKTRKHKDPVAPLFAEHADTEQLAYNLSAFKPGDEVEITLKMHGTSQRTGYLPTLQGYKRTLWEQFTRKKGTPIYGWGGVSGTRRVVLEDYNGGFYGSNEFREKHSKMFDGKLMKGETVYYEVVGFTTTGQPIMGDANNKKLNDKEFIKQYGMTTRFSYGCHPDGTNHLTVNDGEGDPFFDPRPQSDIYVYRMTMTNEDGFVVEYTPDFIRYRCEQMGVKTVPVLWKGIIPEHPASAEDPTITAGEWIKNVAERFYDGPDPIGKTHVREGVVVRIVNRPKFTAYKHKNWSFRVLEGIVKDVATAPDIEEAQEILDEQ